jgi:omega-3 fatty acid desaturase (delta-15 desaturase)
MLFTVTYLQHHSPETNIYDDSTWSYVTAGFETVDRRYGRLNPLAGLNDKLFAGVVPAWVLQFMNLDVDVLHHHISDGHVVHHLFFTKIPHYNLKEATDAMVTYLKENGMGDLYQFEETPDFAIRVVRYMYEFQSRAKLVTTKDM